MNPQDRRDNGAIVRITRHAQGLTLAELGRRTGYSASQVSRYERGVAPLTDTTVLRRFASALELAPQEFGLLPETGRHPAPIRPQLVTCGVPAPIVIREPPVGGR
jgi:transcriptional regulator with XRE-family HTH domain